MKILINIIMTLCQTLASTILIFEQIMIENKNKKIKFFILVFIYTLFISFFIPNQFRFVLFNTVIPLLIYFVLNIKNKLVMLYSFNTILLLSISEIIITSALVLFGIKSSLIVNNIFYNLLANVLISILSISIIKISFVKKLVNYLILLFTKNKKLINYLYLFLLVIYLIVSKNGLELIFKSNYYINILFFIVVFVVLYIIIKNEIIKEQLNEENKQMLHYVTKYEKIITEQGKANHEFKNQLMVIRGYAQLKSDKVIEYIDSIVYDSKKIQSSYLISQLNKFPEGGIKGLLYYKISIMDDEKIKYELDVETGVKTKLNNLSIDMYKNITKILGVLLDNAIDASKKSKDKKINISVSKDKLCVVFVISNTYNGKIDLTKIGTGYSSKGNNHGYGLRLVKDIIEAQDSAFNLETSCEEKLYSTKLTIKINNKKRKSK